MANNEKPVSIIGYSLRAPQCSSVEEFANALKAGGDLTTGNTRYPHGHLGLPPRQGRLKEEDVAGFDAPFFGLSHKQAEAMDPSIRVLLKVSYEALLDAQIDVKSLRGSKTGVYVGHCFSDSLSLLGSASNPNKNGYELVNGAYAMAANRLSYFYDLKGPSVTVDTACSSSLVALDRAVRDIRQGIVERAVVGGLSLTLDPHKNASFHAFTMLSPTGHCYSFDTRANGYCRSDGIACVILEPGSVGYALVEGTGTNCDGAKPQGITYPSSEGQQALMAEVFAKSKINPLDIAYHEAHGTGTIAGDKEELDALVAIYSQSLPIGSVKSNMGHAEGASGLMSVIKILLMFEDHKLYPNFDYQDSPHEAINNGNFVVVQKEEEWKPGLCSVSNFGFGGSNAFAILAPSTVKERSVSTCGPKKFLSTAFASAPGSVPASKHCTYYQIQRSLGNNAAFQYEWKDGGWRESSQLIFVFNGQGSQWNGMGKDLMEQNSTFRSTIKRLEQETGIPLEKLYLDGTQWMLKENSTIGIVSFQLGLLAMLAKEGIQPDIFLGHSLGEIVPAYLAGFQTEAEVLKVAQVRAHLASLIDTDCRLDLYSVPPSSGYDYKMFAEDNGIRYVKKAPCNDPAEGGVVKSFSMKGKMVAVGTEARQIEEIIDSLDLDQTSIACFNGPKGQTISGPETQVDALVKELQASSASLFVRDLPTDNVAYHAPYLQAFRGYLREKFGSINSHPLPSTWKSTSRNSTFDVDYLVENICGSVYFQEAIEWLPRGATVVEIGPAHGLLAQIKRTRSDLNLVCTADKEKPIDMALILSNLKSWVSSTDQLSSSAGERLNSINSSLPFSQRYPNIWGEQCKFNVPTWQDFENSKTSNQTEAKVSYDLTKKPWNTIRDHLIRGQNLFPATGFMHALWSIASFKERTEILDFKVIAPFVITPDLKKIRFHIRRAGQYCEVYGAEDEVCYASGRVQVLSATTTPPETPQFDQNEGIDCQHFYPHIRRLGYEYGAAYQKLDKVTSRYGQLKDTPEDWISYMDTCFHLRLHGESSFGYPVRFRRIVFWSGDLVGADCWIERRSMNTCWNTTISMEDCHIDYLPVICQPTSIYGETFVEYSECDTPLSPDLIAAVLVRESQEFRVKEPLDSQELQMIVKSMKNFPMVRQSDTTEKILIADIAVGTGNLLVTTDRRTPEFPHVLVARWGKVRLLRCKEIGGSTVVSAWQDVPQSDSFIWLGEGSSGAVASLMAERDVSALSYETRDSTATTALPGVDKGMRHNFLIDDNRHGVWVDTKQDMDDPAAFSSPFAWLRVKRPGNLDSLEWSAVEPSDYTVRTHVATLNFRDVMRAMGQLKEKDLSLGLEFSGTDVSTKHRVFGVAKNALSTHCNPIYSFPTPEHLDDTEAATIPVAYLTAYYALFEKAGMEKGQSVLIHAGTGAVGMAAITVAQHRGLRVFATCSAGKRAFLKGKFHLKDNQIGDSRSDQFVQSVYKWTNGIGVDVVLNQLAGPLQLASLRCLAPGGHFCEIGKYDIVQDSSLGQSFLAANVSFHAIDLLPLLQDPANKPKWDAWLSNGFRSKEIHPLPTVAVDAKDCSKAFRFMSQGKHMGKIVIRGLDDNGIHVTSPPTSTHGEVHLITGGLGGLGLSLAHRLAMNGCKKVILISRSGVKSGYQRFMIDEMEAAGCTVCILKKDALTLLKMDAAPDCIWHVATVYDDKPFDKMTESAWDSVVRTKVDAYTRLRGCWPTTPIVTISSVVAYFGNASQTHYALANACLDAAARTDPLTLAVRLGALDNVGFVIRKKEHRALFERVPFKLMRVDDVLDRLLEIRAQQRTGVFGIYDLKDPSFDNLPTSQVGGINKKVASVASPNYGLCDAQNLLANVLGGSPSHYKKDLTLKSVGIDSLSTMEVVHHIHDASGSQHFKASKIGDSFTVQDIVTAIVASQKARPPNQSKTASRQDANALGTKTNPVMADLGPRPESIELDVLEAAPMQGSGTIELSVAPNNIDFGAMTDALTSADYLVLRQADAVVFNHGAPIDSNDKEAVTQYMDKYVMLAQAFATSKTIVVVVIDGEVRGGGMIFPAMADVCIATRNATFGLPEIHRNMVPAVVSRALSERLGRALVRRLSLTGEAFGADQAKQMGLIDVVTDPADCQRQVEGLLRRWKSSTQAAHFIKSELFPRNEGSMFSMGTIAGTWMKNCKESSDLDLDRKVIHASISHGVVTLMMCDNVYQNTMTPEMTSQIRALIPWIKKNACVVILASSLGHFHVGLNPARSRQWSTRSTCDVAADVKEGYMGFVELAQMGIPIIGVLNGKVYGGGLPIALWCDYRVATKNVDVHFGNLSRGMSPAGQLSRLLHVYLPASEVMRAYLENSHWDYNDLLRLGLVAHVANNTNEALLEAQRLGSYIASQPTAAVRDTLHLIKTSYAADLANEEAWLIAQKITQNDGTFKKTDHTPFQPSGNQPVKALHFSQQQRVVSLSQSEPVSVGIVAFECYTPGSKISADTLEQRGIAARSKNGQEAVSVWDAQEDAISCALNAVAVLLERHVKDPYLIGRIEVGTESNVDMAKSIKSYMMNLLPEHHVDVEGVDNTNACYGGTAALLNTLSWCRETGRYGIVVATDTADMDVQDSAWRGASAVAMLIGQNPWIEIHPQRVSTFKNTHDFLKPRYSSQMTPFIHTRESMNHYIESLEDTMDRLGTEHNIDVAAFDAMVFHGGLCVAFMRIVEDHLSRKLRTKWDDNFERARYCASLMGGLYTASMYVNLASLLHKAPPNLNHIGLFSYGSGSSATLMHATIHSHRGHSIDLPEMLEERVEVLYETLAKIVESQTTQDTVAILPRSPGIFYRDLSRFPQREYFQEGGKRFAPTPHNAMQHPKICKAPAMAALTIENAVSSADEEWSAQRKLAAMGVLASSAWWITSLAVFGSLVEETILYSIVSFCCSVMVRIFVDWTIRRGSRVQDPVACSHYMRLVSTYFAYIIFRSIDSATFQKYWSAVYFGVYLFDVLSGVLYWNHLVPSYREFLVIHHCLSFLITGTWRIPEGEWTDTVSLGVMVWLISDLYGHAFNVFRHFCGTSAMSRKHQAIVTIIIFAIEHLQRIVAYCFIFWVDRTDLAWVIFSTGILADMVDVYYQISGLKKQFQVLRFQQQQQQPQLDQLSVHEESLTADSSRVVRAVQWQDYDVEVGVTKGLNHD